CAPGARPPGLSRPWPPSGPPPTSSTPRCGTCPPTGWRSAAPPTPPLTLCSARAGPRRTTPPPPSTPSPGASRGCCPKPASPVGSKPHSSPTPTSPTWPPTPPACAATRTRHDRDTRSRPLARHRARAPACTREPCQDTVDTQASAAGRRERRLRRVRPPHPDRLRPPPAGGRPGGNIEPPLFLPARAADIDAAIGQAITGLRAFGYSWADIATRLGVTRQAAQQRWGARP